jgi:hypothetical protein
MKQIKPYYSSAALINIFVFAGVRYYTAMSDSSAYNNSFQFKQEQPTSLRYIWILSTLCAYYS